MADHEEGEIFDSDEESEKRPVSSFGAYRGVVQSSASVSNVSSYRSAEHHVNSSSSEDYSDEEDSFLWKRKKMRYKAAAANSDKLFNNPLLHKRTNRQNSESDISDTCQSPVKSYPPKIFGAPETSFQSAFEGAKPKRKTNNIWGSVMSEQTLTHTLGGVDVNIPVRERLEYEADDRDVENYDFTQKAYDTRPDPIENEDMEDRTSNTNEDTLDICDKETFGKDDEQKQNERMKRKRKVKDRLGPRKNETENEGRRVSVKERLGKRDIKDRLGTKVPVIVEKPEGYIDVTEDDSVEKVVNALVNNLHEPKVQLMANVVSVLGKQGAINLMHDTEMIEAQGGMMTNDNARRRTPGGVFLQLLKFDSGLSADDLKRIFGDERAADKKERKIRTAVYKNKKREEQKRRQGSLTFLDSIDEYKSIKEQIKEEEQIGKILNNEEVTIDPHKEKSEEMRSSIDEELGGDPDIEIGEF